MIAVLECNFHGMASFWFPSGVSTLSTLSCPYTCPFCGNPSAMLWTALWTASFSCRKMRRVSSLARTHEEVNPADIRVNELGSRSFTNKTFGWGKWGAPDSPRTVSASNWTEQLLFPGGANVSYLENQNSKTSIPLSEIQDIIMRVVTPIWMSILWP